MSSDYRLLRWLYGGGLMLLLLFLLWQGQDFWENRQQAEQLSVLLQGLPEIRSPEIGYERAEEARQVAVELGDEDAVGKAFYFMALYGSEATRFGGYFSERASLLARESIGVFRQTENAFWMSKALLLYQSLDFLNQDRQAMGFAQLDSLMPYLKPAEKPWIEVERWKNQGLLLGKQYYSSGDSMLKANQLLRSAAQYYLAEGANREAAICYRNIGAHHQELVYLAYEIDSLLLGQGYAKAGLAHLYHAFALLEADADSFGAGHVLHKIGRLYTEYFWVSGEPLHLDTALQYFDQNLHEGYPFPKESVYEAIGTVYSHRYYAIQKNQAHQDSCLTYLRASVELALETANLHQFNESLRQLAWDLEENFQQVDSGFIKALNAYDPVLLREKALAVFSDQARTINGQTQQALNQFHLSAAAFSARKARQKILVFGSLLLTAAFFVFIILYQRKRLAKMEQERNFSLRLAQTKMNPHFIGNTLNSIDSLINNEELPDGKEKASEYLVKFSRLAEAILQNSDKVHISLQQELDILKNYIELERLRLNEKFEYTLRVSDDLPLNAIKIPPMLIQPIIENAIWHGLQHKIVHDGEEGELTIVFSGVSGSTAFIRCQVTDNGIGRERARKLQQGSASTQNERSHATDIVEKRLSRSDFSDFGQINIQDLTDAHGQARGTQVTLKIPVFHQ